MRDRSMNTSTLLPLPSSKWPGASRTGSVQGLHNYRRTLCPILDAPHGSRSFYPEPGLGFYHPKVCVPAQFARELQQMQFDGHPDAIRVGVIAVPGIAEAAVLCNREERIMSESR